MGNKKTSIIIPAAGLSTRMEDEVRKPFIEINGEPIILKTCKKLKTVEEIFEIIVALHPDDIKLVEDKYADEFSQAGVTLIVAGGNNRAESVWNALQVVSAEAELVGVHDAVRPFISKELLKEIIKIASKKNAAIPIIPLNDTVKRIAGDTIIETPRRLGLVRVQTPQVFQSDLLIEAFEYALRTGGLTEAITDDASLVENFGKEITAVFGEETNFKITTKNDIKIAQALIAAGLIK